MREQFHGELQVISDQLVEMTHLVGTALERATTALLQADLSLAESVIESDRHIDVAQNRLEDRAVQVLALQQPVATDLRIVVTSLRMSADLERMGDLARHVAKLARLRYPASAIPADVSPTILQMGVVAQGLAAKTGQVIAGRDLAAAAELETDDDAMDDLHRGLFTTLLSPEWTHGIEAAIDVTLCGRYYERFADHAVSVARRVVYLVTGAYPTPN
jgi:phosphate transport system protein